MKALALLLALLFTHTTIAGLPPTSLKGQQGAKFTNFNFEVPANQATKTSTGGLLETGNSNLLVNPGFEHSTISTGWTVSSSASGLLASIQMETTNVYPDGGKQSAIFKCSSTLAVGECSFKQEVPTKEAQGVAKGCFYLPALPIDAAATFYALADGNRRNEIELPDDSRWYCPDLDVTLGATTSGVEAVIKLAYTGDVVEMRADSMSVAAGKARVKGAVVTDTKDYTPFVSSGTGAISNYTVTGSYRRSGSDIEISGSVTFSSTSTAFDTLLISIPPGMTPDVSTSTSERLKYSSYTRGVLEAKPATFSTFLTADLSNLVVQYELTQAIANPAQVVSENILGTKILSGDTIPFKAKFPIKGWSSNVVMSEDAGNREVVGKFTKSGTQALASGTNKLTGYSVAKDSAAGWDSTNNRYVIPENGDYDIFHTIYHNTPSLATVPAFRTIRGGVTGSWIFGSEATSPRQTLADTITDLKKGDFLEVGVYVGGASTINVQDTRFSIAKRSNPKTIGQSEPVIVRAISTSQQSFANATSVDVSYSTETEDSHDAWDGVRFTAPRSGLYRFEARSLLVSMAVNTGRSISMIVPNVGTAIGMRNVVGNHAEHQNFVFGTVRLNKGESAKITLYQDNGAARLLSPSSQVNSIEITSAGN